MFDKTLKVQSTRETLFLRLKCVCVCVFARVCACVCVCARARRAPKQTSKIHFELRARPNDQIHTQYVKTDGLENIHLNTVYILKCTRTVGRKLCVNILSQWQTGASSMLIKEQNTKTKSLTALNLNKVIALIYSENYAVFIYIWSLLDLFCSYYLSEH